MSEFGIRSARFVVSMHQSQTECSIARIESGSEPGLGRCDIIFNRDVALPMERQSNTQGRERAQKKERVAGRTRSKYIVTVCYGNELAEIVNSRSMRSSAGGVAPSDHHRVRALKEEDRFYSSYRLRPVTHTPVFVIDRLKLSDGLFGNESLWSRTSKRLSPFLSPSPTVPSIGVLLQRHCHRKIGSRKNISNRTGVLRFKLQKILLFILSERPQCLRILAGSSNCGAPSPSSTSRATHRQNCGLFIFPFLDVAVLRSRLGIPTERHPSTDRSSGLPHKSPTLVVIHRAIVQRNLRWSMSVKTLCGLDVPHS